jgi:hypothetical protein
LKEHLKECFRNSMFFHGALYCVVRGVEFVEWP